MKEQVPPCVAVMGLGYVGLQLARAFGRVTPTIGFDINIDRVRELQQGYDRNGEVGEEDLKSAKLEFTHDRTCLNWASFIIVAVPTPVDRAKRPNLSYLIEASCLVGRALKSSHEGLNDLAEPAIPFVVYASTVYPGCTY